MNGKYQFYPNTQLPVDQVEDVVLFLQIIFQLKLCEFLAILRLQRTAWLSLRMGATQSQILKKSRTHQKYDDTKKKKHDVRRGSGP